MRRLPLVILGLIVAGALTHMGCMDRKPAPVCPVPTELNETEAKIGGFEGVDMLVVVDNSSSMTEEQEILGTAFFPLINSLVNPTPAWPYPAADDVRVAVTTSDLGFSWGGNPYEDGDGWPTSLPSGCDTAAGDDGAFMGISVGTIDIEDGVIPCDESAAQCPTGWTCGNLDTEGEGVCQAPGGDGTAQACPGLSSTWAETLETAPNGDLAFQVACMAQQGIDGCGFEQQLQSAARALVRSDHDQFIRDKSLLVVLIVSDESDCSIADNALFGVSEIQDTSGGSKVNIACGNHPEHLYSPSDYYNVFTEAKGSSNSVIFAAIVGVPKNDSCQGLGSEIGDCLDEPAMQLVPYQDSSSSSWYFENACTNGTVTEAKPGRRYVDLAANEFGSMGYIYSICEPDWSPAMEEIARLIAENLKGTCYPKPLDWDPSEKVAKCDVLVEYEDQDECPSEYEDDDPTLITVTNDDETEQTNALCRLPKISVSKNCADFDEEEITKFGWFYCENTTREDYTEACEDGIDNDGDGQTDCDDDGCANCAGNCEGTVDCSDTCSYMVQLSKAAEAEVAARSISVQCLQQFSFEDENCQENSEEACTDGVDNDGNGIWDCDTVTEGDEPHYADPNCCPMTKDSDGTCVLSEGSGNKASAQDICGFSGNNYPGACYAAKDLLGCTLP